MGIFRVSAGVLAGWVVALVLVAVLVAYLVFTAPVRQAGRLVKEVSKIEIGATTVDQFRRQLQEAKLTTISITCQASDCTAAGRAEVPSVSRLHLAPPTGIVVSANFKDGIASEVYVWVEIKDHTTAGVIGPGTGATVHESLQSRSCPEHFCTYVRERSGYPWAVVEMDASAPKEIRDRAFAINVGCLTKMGGCKKVSTILPQVFGKAPR
ncbi:MAG TPA: hypothetical protein VKV39_16730 [Candidatus Sulfotelmatobacter sp.]|nr:hypothetical protein [Candidatus Sulfotelmatobacter sp.]